MYQLAAFKTVVDALAARDAVPPQAFAQDPVFNALDKELLGRLGITVVQHPAAFHLICRDTFAFLPRPTFVVTRGVLSRMPGMYIGSPRLITWTDPLTGLSTSGFPTSYPEEFAEWIPVTEAQIKEKKRRDSIKGAQIVELFKRGKECVRLPDLQGRSEPNRPTYYVFGDMHMYWRPSSAGAGPSFDVSQLKRSVNEMASRRR